MKILQKKYDTKLLKIKIKATSQFYYIT